MPRQKQRPVLVAFGAIILVWLLAWSGYVISRHMKMTAEKLAAYQRALDFSKLSAADRMKALKNLADRINALSLEERQKWHLDLAWFAQLTDAEKAYFLDAFMPGEMKQALKLFESWPKERQQKEIDQAFKELRSHDARRRDDPRANAFGTTGAPIMTPELDQKIRTMGLNALYSQASAQTKAELAPLLMEVQKQLESGQLNMTGF